MLRPSGVVAAGVSRVEEGLLLFGGFQVRGDHHVDELLEADLRLPAEGFARLGCIAQEDVHFRRAEIAGVDGHMPLVVEA